MQCGPSADQHPATEAAALVMCLPTPDRALGDRNRLWWRQDTEVVEGGLDQVALPQEVLVPSYEAIYCITNRGCNVHRIAEILFAVVVARARRGDKEPLRHFIGTGLSSDACQAASLNYWAYWIGEVPETHSSDEFMAGDLGPWSGAALLRRFAANLVASEPLADLYAHSLWALLERRGRLLEADPQLARSLASGVEALRASSSARSLGLSAI
jgi:hypothetical protein